MKKHLIIKPSIKTPVSSSFTFYIPCITFYRVSLTIFECIKFCFVKFIISSFLANIIYLSMWSFIELIYRNSDLSWAYSLSGDSIKSFQINDETLLILSII